MPLSQGGSTTDLDARGPRGGATHGNRIPDRHPSHSSTGNQVATGECASLCQRGRKYGRRPLVQGSKRHVEVSISRRTGQFVSSHIAKPLPGRRILYLVLSPIQ